MKTIYLLRHARAEMADHNLADKERRLVKSGIEDARTVAGILKKFSSGPELILSSDTTRTVETAKIIAKKLKIGGLEIVFNGEIFSAENSETILNLIKALDDKYNSVMIIGHNPTLSALAGLLAKSFTFDLPKAGLLGIACSSNTWQEVIPETGQIKVFIAPLKKKRVERLKDELAKALGERIETIVVETISASGVNITPEATTLVRKKSRQIAKKAINVQGYPLLKTPEQISIFFQLDQQKQD